MEVVSTHQPPGGAFSLKRFSSTSRPKKQKPGLQGAAGYQVLLPDQANAGSATWWPSMQAPRHSWIWRAGMEAGDFIEDFSSHLQRGSCRQSSV